MYAFIKGKVFSAQPGIVVIDNNGIGYEINVSDTTYAQVSSAGKGEVLLYTFLSVREDGISLFGFSTLTEKSLFEKLTSISGIGPKTALQILSVDLTALTVAIASRDAAFIAKIKGIGKKTAERIVLELNETLASSDIVKDVFEKPKATVEKSLYSEAEMALVALGFSRSECVKAINSVEDAKTVEELVSKALKKIGAR